MTTKNILLDILESRRESMLRQHHDRAMFTYSEISDMSDMASADAAALQGAQTIAEQARSERDDAFRFHKKQNATIANLQFERNNLTAQLHEAKQTEWGLREQLYDSAQTEDYLREEICKLRQRLQVAEGIAATVRVADLPPAPVTSNSSIDTAKAQTSKPDFVKICRDQLDTCLRDGTWISYAELRNYVTHTATYGEQDQ